MLKKTNLSDKELLEYILGSFELARHYLKYYNEDKFEKDLKTRDAVCYRMYNIGIATNFLSDKIVIVISHEKTEQKLFTKRVEIENGLIKNLI